MKHFSIFRVVLCIALIISLLFPAAYAEEIPLGNEKFDVTDSEFLIKNLDEFKTAFIDEDGNELRYNSYDGNFYYVYAGEEYLIEILDVSCDGVIHWQISSEQLDMEGYTNTSGAPMPQMSVAIGTGTVFISAA